MSNKLVAGRAFPEIRVDTLDHGEITLGQPKNGKEWQLVVVYRGKHCPLCTKYLAQLNEMLPKFFDEGVDVVVASGDPKEKAMVQAKEKIGLNIPVGIELSIPQMQKLGLYISNPRSEKETDRPFPEPGIFVVNEQNNLHVVDISNNPFVRPDLEKLLSGLKWIRDPENDYPIRGTYQYD